MPIAEGFNQFDGYSNLVCKGRPTPPKRVPSKQLGVETKGCKMNSQSGHKGFISKNFYKLLLVYPVERLRAESRCCGGKAKGICDGCCGTQFGTGNVREWNFYNPFKKLYGLTPANGDEYPQGKILKPALVNCLHRSKDEVNTGNKWNLRNMP